MKGDYVVTDLSRNEGQLYNLNGILISAHTEGNYIPYMVTHLSPQ